MNDISDISDMNGMSGINDISINGISGINGMNEKDNSNRTNGTDGEDMTERPYRAGVANDTSDTSDNSHTSRTDGKLTTHVLDLSKGIPASGMGIKLYRLGGAGERTEAELLVQGVTNPDGRLNRPLLEGEALQPGVYELVFDAGSYFKRSGNEAQAAEGGAVFLELVPVRFCVTDSKQHYHIPLLVAPGGYSTYRGS